MSRRCSVCGLTFEKRGKGKKDGRKNTLFPPLSLQARERRKGAKKKVGKGTRRETLFPPKTEKIRKREGRFFSPFLRSPNMLPLFLHSTFFLQISFSPPLFRTGFYQKRFSAGGAASIINRPRPPQSVVVIFSSSKNSRQQHGRRRRRRNAASLFHTNTTTP